MKRTRRTIDQAIQILSICCCQNVLGRETFTTSRVREELGASEAAFGLAYAAVMATARDGWPMYGEAEAMLINGDYP